MNIVSCLFAGCQVDIEKSSDVTHQSSQWVHSRASLRVCARS